jgi:hypothetical protein
MNSPPEPIPSKQQLRLLELLQPKPAETYDAIAKRLREAQTVLHAEIAHQVERPLNKELALMPHELLADKQALAKWLNAEMRALGIAVKCKKSNKPTFLRGAVGYDSVRGRFQLCNLNDRQSKYTWSSIELVSFEFMPSPVRYTHRPKTGTWAAKSSGNAGSRQL